jgi:ABC-type Fe3+-hydroxamate transport system substrate-binding protein
MKSRLTLLALTLALLVVLAACGAKTTLTTSPPATSSEPGEAVSIYFDDDGNTVGQVFVRAGIVKPDGYVSFLVEIPKTPDRYYRLNSFSLEFVSEKDQPSILVEPSGQLFNGMEFSQIDNVVRIGVPYAGKRGNSTILINFLAEDAAFAGDGLRLNSMLEMDSGTGRASLLIKPATP